MGTVGIPYIIHSNHSERNIDNSKILYLYLHNVRLKLIKRFFFAEIWNMYVTRDGYTLA